MLKMKKLFSILITGFSIFLLFFIAIGLTIGFNVKNRCLEAKKEYDGNCVNALINLLNDKNKSLRLRNSAIWALGQLGDNQALPILQKYYTGNIPKKESLDKTISQYELKKAINLTGGGFNISAVIWRNNLFGSF